MGNNASSIAEEGALLPEPTNKEDEWGACSALLMDSSSFRYRAVSRAHAVPRPTRALPP